MKVYPYIALTLVLLSCAPKIGSKIIAEQASFSNQEPVLVLKQFDDQTIEGIKVGSISSKDSGFSSNCSYFEIIEPLKDLARIKGANLIKITRHKPANALSTCEYIFADIYRVAAIGVYEKEIIWSANRKLKWRDFKGKPRLKLHPNIAAMTHCGFSFTSNRVTAFKKAKFFVQNTFDCSLSWANPAHVGNKDVLEHEQGHFDISEVYKRILEERLNGTDISVADLQATATVLMNKTQQEYLDEQEKYEDETNYGRDREKQKMWTSSLSLRLD